MLLTSLASQTVTTSFSHTGIFWTQCQSITQEGSQKLRLQVGFSSPHPKWDLRFGPLQETPEGPSSGRGHHSLGSPLRVSEILLGKLEHCVCWESLIILPTVS